jgi:hypothetical protein
VHSKIGPQPTPRQGFGWRFGNTIDGSQAEYLLVPDAMTNLAAVPDELSDEQVLMCPDIMSTGLSGAERANIRIGDTVAVFAPLQARRHREGLRPVQPSARRRAEDRDHALTRQRSCRASNPARTVERLAATVG